MFEFGMNSPNYFAAVTIHLSTLDTDIFTRQTIYGGRRCGNPYAYRIRYLVRLSAEPSMYGEFEGRTYIAYPVLGKFFFHGELPWPRPGVCTRIVQILDEGAQLLSVLVHVPLIFLMEVAAMTKPQE